ncbi:MULTISPECIES: thiazole tautomerase TenI [Bacillus]|uniref:Thiazole tautomerase TenI n=1 Tax=Bacillus pumilus TaxID=1408 RepID=A0AAE3WHJ8_BACPU|nr:MULTISPECIES: thiazole tautomerase TenI [Bacillus]MCY7618680.1 thiazole tautomerase TenI [Bacillus pumilus]MDR4249057.1 thiazole tautomerase TenI [Bacillus pumilus]PAC83594.1 thiamine phosphate synthase [Bacillus sp. 7788]PRS45579.1 thiamine phosphate synthase [Bacillus sp. NMCC46]PRS82850.1 thiamine phosphate synthase [Bacillus sp. CJCL2]
MELHAVTNDSLPVDELIKQIKAIAPEVDFIHIRERSKTASELVDLVKRLFLEGVPKEKLIINDRVDVALLTNIHRVHLPGHSFSPKELRQKFPHLHAGVSVHSIEEAKAAEKNGAEYVMFGHVYDTTCKPGLQARGVQLVKELTSALSIPVVAIGGLTPDRIPELKHANVKGIAVMSGIFTHHQPRMMAQAFSKQVKEHPYEEAL